MEGVWREMEKLVKDGLVRDIGVSNFTLKKLSKLLQCAQIMPSVCQVKPADAVQDWIKLYSSESPLMQVSDKLNKTPGQVLLKWAMQRGTSVIPKSTNAERIKGNIQLFGWAIPQGDFEVLNSMMLQRRAVDGEEIFVNKSEGPYKTVAELWDDEV
ncbi:hypothetical protein B296_00010070 [Ensete ventricosum]|uniref:NADP-dependent oxidoreductase domain-containing protein n=1 Tax=Ensete ventricosum TaxID=4639 RepID=A0A427A5B8_ENSVE|nr:hypothetical protein B296_00010070 [Ensete ventricosum]